MRRVTKSDHSIPVRRRIAAGYLYNIHPLAWELGSMDRSLLLRALLAMLTTLAMHSAWSAEDSPDKWERRTFQNPREAGAILNSYKYGLKYWNAGDHTVPRLYIAWVPERWRKVYGPKAATSDKKRFFLFIFAPL